MGQIILARAGTTDFDEQDRIAGTLDLPLNLRGQAEVLQMAREMEGLPIERIFAANSEAARETAKFLGEHMDVKVRILEELTNQYLGLWQGLQVDEVRRRHRKVFRQWEESPTNICPPAGEMVDEVLERIEANLRPVLKRSRDELVVLVAPDPLRQLIRCYLTHSDITNLCICENGNPTTWETIEVPETPGFVK